MMKNLDKLSRLLRMLDDESPEVRRNVRKKLKDYGPELKDDLIQLINTAPPDDTERLKNHFKQAKYQWIKELRGKNDKD